MTISCPIVITAANARSSSARTRRDRGRLFIELTPEALAAVRIERAERAVPTRETWWGYDTLQVDDPDGNELLFPRPD